MYSYEGPLVDWVRWLRQLSAATTCHRLLQEILHSGTYKIRKTNFSFNTKGAWNVYQHMITYVTYGHEATKTCQVQPRNKTLVSFKAKAYWTHRNARNIIIRPNTVTVSMGVSSAYVLKNEWSDNKTKNWVQRHYKLHVGKNSSSISYHRRKWTVRNVTKQKCIGFYWRHDY